ncbi:hypothetical protein EHO62_04725 [Leptospira kmetyi]|nr:hypothetical protein EHO62_04725 [Leptospira kmetyi]TGK28754.1 hypothetical protein EHO66_14205 [Leptospira kmetyi]
MPTFQPANFGRVYSPYGGEFLSFFRLLLRIRLSFDIFYLLFTIVYLRYTIWRSIKKISLRMARDRSRNSLRLFPIRRGCRY